MNKFNQVYWREKGKQVYNLVSQGSLLFTLEHLTSTFFLIGLPCLRFEEWKRHELREGKEREFQCVCVGEAEAEGMGIGDLYARIR